MHICFTVSAMQTGGAERVVSTLSNELAVLGHKVTIIMVSVSQKESVYKLNENVELFALCEGYKNRVFPTKRVRILQRKVLDIKPDIVIAFLPHICVYTWAALKNTNVPFIVSERNDPNQYSKVYKLLIKQAFNKANGCVFQTHDELNWYRKKPRITDRVIFNVVGLTYTPEINENINKKQNVIFVGRIDAQKNYQLLLKAFSIFLDQHTGFVLDIYGDGPEKETFLSLASEMNLMDNIRYHGRSLTWHRDEFNAGMFVSTSDYEGMSNSLEEAATLGIPCVATDCPIGGSRELANVFDNIMLSPVGDAQLFANQMEKAFAMNVSFNGINEKVSKAVVVGQWLSLIEQLVSDRNI